MFCGGLIKGAKTEVYYRAFGIFNENNGTIGDRCFGLLINPDEGLFYLVFEMSGFELFQLDNKDGSLNLTIWNVKIF